MEKEYEFYPIDEDDKSLADSLHRCYLEDRTVLYSLGQYLEVEELQDLQRACAKYEHVMAFLLPESKAWSDSEWEDMDAVMDILQKKHNAFLKESDGSVRMYSEETSYYEAIFSVLERHFSWGQNEIMLFMADSQSEELVLDIARLLGPKGHEKYLLDTFVGISECLIAFVRNEREDIFADVLSNTDFKQSFLFQHVTALNDAGKLSQKIKEVLYTVSVLN